MLNLIVPMAGLGSRFSKGGEKMPKPLIDLHGHPFFWWAVESVKASNKLASLSFIVLQDHITKHGIDQVILSVYPDANIIVLKEVTKGAAETAWLGIRALSNLVGSIGFLDCDHAFDIGNIEDIFESGEVYGALCYFKSQSSAYSYLILDIEGQITGTVEKRVVSDKAIAGFYLFSDKSTFENHYKQYVNACPYDELFMSGIFNLLINSRRKVNLIELKKHLSFGTPEELAMINKLELDEFPEWFSSEVKES